MMKIVAPQRILRGGVVLLAGLGVWAPTAAKPAAAQWSTVYEQTYLPASHNWAFRRSFNAAERLFYAFDYGHAILYETLLTRPDAPVTLLEDAIYRRLTERVLVRPPHVPLEEGAIEIAYAKLVPEAKVMFDWAHVLHRQVYDVWADERVPLEQKDGRIAELLAYYRSRPDIAFSTVPKSMDIMDGQYYSLAFRERYPKFNGLIWAYHWLQIGLYEPILVGRTSDERQALVRGTIARFWQMLENPPETMPYLMPMTAAIAPTFAARYPEVAIIFDNLHMMHDVISDVLASPAVPRERKREEIMRAARMFRDDTSFVTTVDEWRQMARGMGLENQGGPAVGFLPELPTPTVPRGMSMAGMDHSQVHGGHGEAAPPQGAGQDAHADHAAPGAGAGTADHDMGHRMEMHERMMADPVIRERVATDPVLQRMMRDAMGGMAPAAGRTMDPAMMAAMEFIVRLFADPAIESRIHADPRLHELWSDPEVQRQLQMIRRMHEPDAGGQNDGAQRRPEEQQPGADGHQH
jgi:hypothetical protein